MGHLHPTVLEDIVNNFKPWGKKEILVNKGSVADKLFYINEGYALLKVQLNGKEWVRHIAQQNEFITSVESFEKGVGSTETIIAVGKFDIYYINKSDFYALKTKHREVETMYSGYINNALISCQNRINDLLGLDAEQYYEKLLKEKKSIMNSIPQYQLASYMGIKPQSLSRIRNLIRSIY